MNVRWQTAVHEAAHACAAVAIGGECSRLAIFSDGGGLATLDGLTPFGIAIATAAATAAVELLGSEPPPPEPDPAASDVRQAVGYLTPSEELAALASRFPADTTPSDERTIALYCITRCEVEGPEHWVARFHKVHARARRVVEDHRVQILSVARALFARGVLHTHDIEKEMGRT